MRLPVHPYRVPTDAVRASPWTRDGEDLGSTLTGWDYQTSLSFSRTVSVDVARTYAQSGLSADCRIAVHVRSWASGSLVKTSALRAPLPGPDASTGIEEVAVDVEVSGATLAGELTLETNLVLTSGRPGRFAAHRPGSILWTDVKKVVVEGTGGLLPVAPVRFSEHGLPAGAAWYVSLDGSDWSDPAMGSLLVLLNTENAGVDAALGASADPALRKALWDSLMVDIVCDLVGRAVEDDEFVAQEDDEVKLERDASTAAMVNNLIRLFLRNTGESAQQAVDRLREERRRDPSRMRATAQSRLQFMGATR